jgi:uncharacterized membrane protein
MGAVSGGLEVNVVYVGIGVLMFLAVAIWYIRRK